MRTHFCGLVDETLIGQTVTLAGWTDVARNQGGVCFIDLRDHEGIVQVTVEVDNAEVFAVAASLGWVSDWGVILGSELSSARPSSAALWVLLGSLGWSCVGAAAACFADAKRASGRCWAWVASCCRWGAGSPRGGRAWFCRAMRAKCWAKSSRSDAALPAVLDSAGAGLDTLSKALARAGFTAWDKGKFIGALSS